MVACSLNLLGSFALRSPDDKELPLPTRKDRLLLAYLALSDGRPLARDRLAGLLWGDRAESQARDSLRQSLAAIRQAFRLVALDPLTSDRDSVTFNTAGIDIDAIAFALLVTEGSLDEAVGLYRGSLLEGVDGISPEFDLWLGPERDRLTAIAVGLLDQIATSGGQSRAIDGALQLGRQLLARDPLCEPVYRAMMHFHVGNEERSAALKVYAACRNALQEELGVAPETKTEQLYRDILTDRPTSPSGLLDSHTDVLGRAVAVLPFNDLSGESGLAHLCEGLAEDIATGLGRFRLLFVIDRHSSAAVSEHASDVVEIGRRLGVGHIVQGSLQKLGDRVRITVRLIDAISRAQRWGEAYDIALSDILSIPDKVTTAIVSTLYGRVESSLLEQSRRKPELAAYECLLRGLKHLRGYAPDDNKRAVELFQQAVDLDPHYALARAYRGFAEVVLHGYSDAPDEILDQARSLATAAVELDESDGQCHFLLGLIQRYRGDLQSGERHYERAMALNPNDANVIVTSSRVLANRGRFEEAIDRIREAMRRNPYHPDWYWVNLGTVLYEAGRYADAAEAFGRARGYWMHCRIAGCYAQLGLTNEAKEEAARALRLRPDFSVAKLRLRECHPAAAEHIRDGLRKAGFPE